MTARRQASSLVAALLCAAAGVALPAPASAASGYCDRGTGVTVVVDNGSLGGGTSVGCDPAGAGTAGSTVVPRAGFPLTYVARQPGFVCRVAGLPDSSRETCGTTPPADAYWGLFWSDGRSGTWTYASVGIGSLKVPAGGFIGWRFQGGGSRVDPGPAPVSPAPSPTPAPDPTPTQPGTGTTGGSAGGSSTVPAPTPTRPRSTAPRPSATRSSAGPSAGSGGSGDPAEPGTDALPAGPSASGSPGAKVTREAQKSRASGTPSPSTATPSGSADPSADASTTGSPSASPTGSDGDLTAGEEAAGSSGPGLPIVAGGLLVALAGAAGTLAWRRRGV